MSKLETNTIDTISGSTNLTLGGTNATDITIPSGVTITNNGTQSGFGGTNTPAFYAKMSTDQSIADKTNVKINFNTEVFDVGSCYDATTNYRFTVPSGQAGKYFIASSIRFNSDAVNNFQYAYNMLYKNGSAHSANHINTDNNPTLSDNINVNGIFDLSVGDYFEVFGHLSVISSGSQEIDASEQGTTSYFYGYKIIE